MRSDREHCASRVAVEQEEEERRGGEEQATDIKSNNPHLAGGEKQNFEIEFCEKKVHKLVPLKERVTIYIYTSFSTGVSKFPNLKMMKNGGSTRTALQN